MSRYTLGLSYGFHDASAALVRDGRVVAAVAEERLSRQKHDDGFPWQAVDACLAAAGIDVDALDAVVYHESPAATFTRVLASTLQGFPGSRREFVAAMKAWLGKKLWAEATLSRRLGVAPARVRRCAHHESHAYQAFLGSGREAAAILTVDAVGEWATTTLAVGRHGRVTTLETMEFPDSLGLVYSAFTAYLGFRPMDAECSTMALAAFGRPVYADAVRAMLQPAADGTYAVDQRYFDFHGFFGAPYTALLTEVLGPARLPGASLPFACLPGEGRAPTGEEQRLADVAASVQLVLEETLLGLARRLHRLTGLDHLCFAGGVALNCVANARLLRDGPFASLFVPPDPGDGGAAAGAALAHDAAVGGAELRDIAYTPHIGPRYGVDATAAMLTHIDPRAFRRHVKAGYRPSPREAWDTAVVTDPAALVEMTADALAGGAIVGWCQGAAENGPRALGARSLLIRPDDPALARRLSRFVKDRAPYRPYALAMTEAAAATILEAPPAGQWPLRWMQVAWPVRVETRTRVVAGVHVDGTTRPQVVAPDKQPLFHALLAAVGERTGLACLVNTSFNEAGAPIVSSPVDALAAFARTDIDFLVLETLFIRKCR